jgi:hypothetical protein
MRKLPIIATLVLCGVLTSAPARAEVALGGFVGEPTGLDVKLGLGPRSALDLLFGWETVRDFGGGDYAHLTYLVTPLVAHGDSVLVPLRLGIGAAVYGTTNNVDVGVRFPLEIGLRFRSAPLELYGEIALLIGFPDPSHGPYADLQGGLGLRFYF